jgi:hypothetical protein
MLFRKLCIVNIYRSPSGKFRNFVAHFDLILHTIHHPKVNFIVCANSNIAYLKDADKVRQFNALLRTYNLINKILLLLLLLLKVLQLQRSFGLPNEFFPFGTVFDAVLPICYFHICYVTFLRHPPTYFY